MQERAQSQTGPQHQQEDPQSWAVKLPKIELHRHLEGSLRIATLVELAAAHDIVLPGADPETLRPYVQMVEQVSDFTQFLAKFDILRQFYISKAAIQRITREAIADAASDNVTMGFYPAHVIVAEARRHGVEIRGADVHVSEVGATVEAAEGQIGKSQINKSANGQISRRGSGEGAIRLGLEMVRGLGSEAGAAIVAARDEHPFRSLADLCLRTGLGRRALEALIMAGALDRWGRTRRQLLWELQSALQSAKAAPALGLKPKGEPTFAALPRHERLWLEQTYTGATAGAHITALVGRQLRQMGATPSGELERWPDGTRIRIGGVVVARQRPPTANGIAFLAVEDADGIINIMLPADVVDAYRRPVMSRFIVVEGKIQRDGAAMTVVGQRVIPLGISG